MGCRFLQICFFQRVSPSLSWSKINNNITGFTMRNTTVIPFTIGLKGRGCYLTYFYALACIHMCVEEFGTKLFRTISPHFSLSSISPRISFSSFVPHRLHQQQCKEARSTIATKYAQDFHLLARRRFLTWWYQSVGERERKKLLDSLSPKRMTVYLPYY